MHVFFWWYSLNENCYSVRINALSTHYMNHQTKKKNPLYESHEMIVYLLKMNKNKILNPSISYILFFRGVFLF